MHCVLVSLLLLTAGENIQVGLSFVPSLATVKKVSDTKSRLLYKTTPPPPVTETSAFMTAKTKDLPRIIQGGMGVHISSWKLAREVSKKGGIGVISGTAMDTIFVRTLQDGKHLLFGLQLAVEVALIPSYPIHLFLVMHVSLGDPGGHFRRALATFPNQAMVQNALERYFIPKGKSPTKPYRSLPLWTLSPTRQLEEATILGNYCEVWLAKHNDDGR